MSKFIFLVCFSFFPAQLLFSYQVCKELAFYFWLAFVIIYLDSLNSSNSMEIAVCTECPIMEESSKCVAGALLDFGF